MQPQDAGGSGFDWMHAVSALAGAIFGALSAIGAWIYKAGGQEPTIRLDFQKSLDGAEKRVENKIEQAERSGETKLEALVDQFHESFSALRQKINDVELEAVKNFVAKPDFDDFRREYREDQRRTDDKLDQLIKMRQ